MSAVAGMADGAGWSRRVGLEFVWRSVGMLQCSGLLAAVSHVTHAGFGGIKHQGPP